MATLKGADKIARALRQLPEKVAGRRLDEAVRLAAQVVAEQAQVLAPKDTGRLRGSIDVKKDGRRSSAANSVYNVGYRQGATRDDPTGAYYGGVVELGAPARGLSAQPYLRPAIAQKADEATDIIARRLQRALGLN